jgi:hypothetical protein
MLRLRQPASQFETSAGDAPEGQEVVGSELLKALHGLGDSSAPAVGHKRGRICEWSDSSRSNLHRQLKSLLNEAWDVSMFVGITYPAEFPAPESHEIYKGHLRAFMARVRRKYPAVSFFWKLEFQERGAAHFHLVLFGLPERSDAVQEEWRTWSKKAWYDIVGSGDRHHLKRGVTSDWVKSRRGASGYLAKYLGKDDQTRPGDFTGRYWGKHNEAALPVAALRKVAVSNADSFKVRRVFRGLIKSQVNDARRLAVLKKVGWWHEKGGATWMDVEGWYNKPGSDRFLPAVSPNWTGPTRLSFPNPASRDDFNAPSLPFRMPAKWKPRNNLSVTLFCDASKVWVQLEKWLKSTRSASSAL